MGRLMEKIFQTQTLDCDAAMSSINESQNSAIGLSSFLILRASTEFEALPTGCLRLRAAATSMVCKCQKVSREKWCLILRALRRMTLRTEKLIEEFASSASLAISFFVAVAATISLACVFGAPAQLIGTLLVVVLFTAIGNGAMRARQDRISELSGRDKEHTSFDRPELGASEEDRHDFNLRAIACRCDSIGSGF